MINSEILIPPSTDAIVQTSLDIQSSNTPADIRPLLSIDIQTSTADVQTSASDVQPSTSVAANVESSTSAASDVQPSTSTAADVQPSTSEAAGTVVILDFGKTKLPKHTYTEFNNIFQVEQPSLEIDGAMNFEKNQKNWTN